MLQASTARRFPFLPVYRVKLSCTDSDRSTVLAASREEECKRPFRAHSVFFFLRCFSWYRSVTSRPALCPPPPCRVALADVRAINFMCSPPTLRPTLRFPGNPRLRFSASPSLNPSSCLPPPTPPRHTLKTLASYQVLVYIFSLLRGRFVGRSHSPLISPPTPPSPCKLETVVAVFSIFPPPGFCRIPSPL